MKWYQNYYETILNKIILKQIDEIGEYLTYYQTQVLATVTGEQPEITFQL